VTVSAVSDVDESCREHIGLRSSTGPTIRVYKQAVEIIRCCLVPVHGLQSYKHTSVYQHM